MGNQKADAILEKIYVLVIKVVNFQKNEPTKNANIKVFKLEKEPITPTQWAENLKNRSPFKRLILSMNTDNNGTVTAELTEGFYEVEVENFGIRVLELKRNDEVLFIEPKKYWWH